MYLRDLAIHASDEIVDRHPGGFVQKFHRDTCCITELYSKLIHRQATTADDAKIQLVFTDTTAEPPDKALPLNCVWPFDFAKYNRCEAFGKKQLIIDTMQDALLWVAGKRVAANVLVDVHPAIDGCLSLYSGRELETITEAMYMINDLVRACVALRPKDASERRGLQ